MDPYLESHWEDVHTRLIVYACDQLQGRLPSQLHARVEERVVIESPPGTFRGIRPDVRVFEKPRGKKVQPGSIGIAMAEPFVIETQEEITRRSIEIRDRSNDNRLVTVIEVLSPSNKTPGSGLDDYLKKREELRKGGVSQVEIDLVRAGTRPLPLPIECLPETLRTTYNVWARRAWRASTLEIYRMPLTERLPVVRVPLRPADADSPLDLQALIDSCYRNGDYEYTIDYRVEPEPALSPQESAWADALLRKLGKREKRKRRPGQRNSRS
jgi:hypothetical protein